MITFLVWFYFISIFFAFLYFMNEIYEDGATVRDILVMLLITSLPIINSIIAIECISDIWLKLSILDKKVFKGRNRG